ncbi:MAG: undecaprenyldiphospho-muramoylpentapeptide beta-N-acetylglucosaminyltransferase [Gammaproteobacteria bacterium]
MQHKPIMIMAGGTGGHIYPALAVAEFIRSRDIPLYWLGTRRGLEAVLVPRQGIELFTLSVDGIRGKGLRQLLLSPFRIVASICRAMRIFLRLKPAAVLGMGGFAAGPGGIAACLLRIPLYIHEQNRIAGLTNKLLAPLARLVFQGFPKTFPARDGVITSGNPVRRAICELPEPQSRMAGRSGSIKVLILGGSQGALCLNRLLPQALSELGKTDAVEVWHQCGIAHHDSTAQVYAGLDLSGYKLEAFIEDMAAAYAWADLAVCRAGALTIAELCAAGLGAVLIPFPHAVDDHQTMNARYMSDANAAVLCPEAELDVSGLQSLLSGLVQDRQTLINMAVNSRQLAQPDAARVVGEYCIGERS